MRRCGRRGGGLKRVARVSWDAMVTRYGRVNVEKRVWFEGNKRELLLSFVSE